MRVTLRLRTKKLNTSDAHYSAEYTVIHEFVFQVELFTQNEFNIEATLPLCSDYKI